MGSVPAVVADLTALPTRDLSKPRSMFCSTEQVNVLAQEVLQAPQRYDGKPADVWSCGVHLYIMLVGWYPFTDPRDPKNFNKTASNIMKGRYAYPRNLSLSQECQDLIKAMLQRDPQQRITIQQIKESAWFRTNLSRELAVYPSPLCFTI